MEPVGGSEALFSLKEIFPLRKKRSAADVKLSLIVTRRNKESRMRDSLFRRVTISDNFTSAAERFFLKGKISFKEKRASEPPTGSKAQIPIPRTLSHNLPTAPPAPPWSPPHSPLPGASQNSDSPWYTRPHAFASPACRGTLP